MFNMSMYCSSTWIYDAKCGLRLVPSRITLLTWILVSHPSESLPRFLAHQHALKLPYHGLFTRKATQIMLALRIQQFKRNTHRHSAYRPPQEQPPSAATRALPHASTYQQPHFRSTNTPGRASCHFSCHSLSPFSHGE